VADRCGIEFHFPVIRYVTDLGAGWSEHAGEYRVAFAR